LLGTLRVNDLNPQEQVWFTGNLTFYDPAVLNYGEDRGDRGPSMRTEDVEHVIGVAVFVKAYSEYDAQQRALQNSKDALHVLSFAFSVSRQHGGFRPQMAEGIATYQIERKRWSWRWHSDRADQNDVLLAKIQNVVGIARGYNGLILLSTQASTPLTALQQGFLDSLHWYVRGRWDPDPVERFLFYWIGLEHLFVAGKQSKKKDLFDLLPRLYNTWTDLGGVTFFFRSLRQIRSSLKGNNALSTQADHSIALRGWRTDDRIFMKPRKIHVLNRIFAVADADVQAHLDEYIKSLQSLLRQRRKIKKAIGASREASEVALRLLYDWRNRMAHEGAPYQPGMEFYANKLERILENILRKMVVELLKVDGICKTTDALIALYKGPFI
jgi:hypothetical protein